MQFFGLVSLLLAVAVGVWWFTNDPVLQPTDTSVKNYQEAIEAAEEAVGMAGLGSTVSVYEGIPVSTTASVLDLSDRGLRGSLKAEVRQLTKLKVLDLSNNNFTNLPAEVGHLSQLEVLNLSNNPLTGLPHELGNLSNLQTLDLRNTEYSTYDLQVIREGLSPDVQILVN